MEGLPGLPQRRIHACAGLCPALQGSLMPVLHCSCPMADPELPLLQGETFFAAARHATDLLTRNFLKAYGVWWFPPMVVQCAAFLLSVAWGLVTFLTAWLVWRHQSGNSGQQASRRACTGCLHQSHRLHQTCDAAGGKAGSKCAKSCHVVLLLCCWSRALLQALAAAPPSAVLSPAGGCLAELHQATL